MSEWILTAKDEGIILNALRVAADMYENDAFMMEHEGQKRLAEQFRKQAGETRALLEAFE